MNRRRAFICGAVLGLALPPVTVGAQYSAAVEQWRPSVESACAVYGCSTDYLLSVLACESNGDPGAVGPNGELGIYQVQPAIWGVMSSGEQIQFAAKHLTAGDVFWVCA